MSCTAGKSPFHFHTAAVLREFIYELLDLRASIFSRRRNELYDLGNCFERLRSGSGDKDRRSRRQSEPFDFTPPLNGTADELVNFLAEMITFEPQSKEEAAEYQRVAKQLMNTVARKVLEVEKDRTSDNYRFAAKYLLAIEAMTVHELKPERRKQLMGVIAGQIRSKEADSDDLDIAVTFAEGLEMIGDNVLAATAYQQFSEILKNSEDPLANRIIEIDGRRRTSLESAGKHIAGRWHHRTRSTV